jgi:hypothetical protein
MINQRIMDAPAASGPPTRSLAEVKEILLQCGQGHILEAFPDLNEEHPIFRQVCRVLFCGLDC